MLKHDEARQAMGLNSLAIIRSWGPEESVQGVLKCIETVVH